LGRINLALDKAYPILIASEQECKSLHNTGLRSIES
jgi:hypothetical protein